MLFMNNFIRINNIILNQNHLICIIYNPEISELKIYLKGDIEYSINMPKNNMDDTLNTLINEINK